MPAAKSKQLAPAQGWRAPNLLLRTALFRATHSRVSRSEYTRIATTKDVTLDYRGETLTQFDLDVYAALLEQFSYEATPSPKFGAARVQFSLAELGRMMGRNAKGAEELARRKASLERLKEGRIKITVTNQKQPHKTVQLTTSLISLKTTAGLASKYTAWVHEEVAELFARGSTETTAEVRKTLAGHPLAAWLHGWITSQKQLVFYYGLETLMELSGSCELGELDQLEQKKRQDKVGDFKRRLEAALIMLQTNPQVVGVYEFIEKVQGKGLKLKINRFEPGSSVKTVKPKIKRVRLPRKPSIMDAFFMLGHEELLRQAETDDQVRIPESNVQRYAALQARLTQRKTMLNEREQAGSLNPCSHLR